MDGSYQESYQEPSHVGSTNVFGEHLPDATNLQRLRNNDSSGADIVSHISKPEISSIPIDLDLPNVHFSDSEESEAFENHFSCSCSKRSESKPCVSLANILKSNCEGLGWESHEVEKQTSFQNSNPSEHLMGISKHKQESSGYRDTVLNKGEVKTSESKPNISSHDLSEFHRAWRSELKITDAFQSESADTIVGTDYSEDERGKLAPKIRSQHFATQPHKSIEDTHRAEFRQSRTSPGFHPLTVTISPRGKYFPPSDSLRRRLEARSVVKDNREDQDIESVYLFPQCKSKESITSYAAAQTEPHNLECPAPLSLKSASANQMESELCSVTPHGLLTDNTNDNKQSFDDSTNEQNNKCFLDLPDDILYRILDAILFSDLCACSMACRRLHAICQLIVSPWQHLQFQALDWDVQDDCALKALMHAYQKTSVFSINFYGCQSITDKFFLDVHTSQASQNLRSLILFGCSKITSHGLNSFLQHTPKLQVLDIRECIYLDKGIITGIIKLPQLSELYISHHFDLSANDLAQVCVYCQKLRVLTVKNCLRLTPDWLRALPSTIETLELMDLPLFDDDNVSLAVETQTWKLNLKRLSLNGCCNLTDVGVGVFLQSLTNLRSIDLSNCYIITDSTMHLLSKCAFLQHVYLDGCGNISDQGLLEVAQTCLQLSRIHLSDCGNITQAAIDNMLLANIRIVR